MAKLLRDIVPLNELSKKTLKSYAGKAMKQTSDVFNKFNASPHFKTTRPGDYDTKYIRSGEIGARPYWAVRAQDRLDGNLAYQTIPIVRKRGKKIIQQRNYAVSDEGDSDMDTKKYTFTKKYNKFK
jgi:hypothetical protein